MKTTWKSGVLALLMPAVSSAKPATVEESVNMALAAMANADGGFALEFAPREARWIRLVIHRTNGGAPCLDELEIYGPDARGNLAKASRGAQARASSVLPGHAIHVIAHLNDGLYGNDHSWIAAAEGEQWAEIELPAPAKISRVILSRDRSGKFTDRQVTVADVRGSMDGQSWETVATLTRQPPPPPTLTFPAADLSEKTWNGVVEYAFLRERDTWSRMDAKDYLSPLLNDRPAMSGGAPYWGRMARLSPLERTLTQFGEMIERLSAQGVKTEVEQGELADLKSRARQPAAKEAIDALYLTARHAKRRLFFRDPRLAPLEHVLFSKRHPLKPSHNYSEHLDSLFAPGGGVCVLRIPRDADCGLDPARGIVKTLFDGSAGIVRHPVGCFDARTIYFAYRPDKPAVAGWQSYWRLMSVRSDGSGLRQLTKDEPFHDFDPLPLPDGGLGFISTRGKARFLCWRPQAYVLHRMEPDGSNIKRLSYANLSEWDPSMMGDGRILWTRTEYLDKGADFGHTLWAIHPDGSCPELVFGNDTPYCYGHARQMPGTREIVCTLISHGDHQGPIALIDLKRGLYETASITNITPDTRPQYQMDRSYHETFRDPEPVSCDHILVSHNPGQRDHWGIYVIDRFGNRELLYLDPEISSKKPSPLRVRPRPPELPDTIDPALARAGLGQFTVQDVYQGLGDTIARGQVKYLQVSQEVPANLATLSDGQYCSDHPPFGDFYATPVYLLGGPPHSYTTRSTNALQPHAFRAGSAAPASDGLVTVTERSGWPSYVAKAVLGTIPIAADGSANFTAPAGKVLYFHLLDENFTELQRMRSVIQLQPGERRSCVGCHEDRVDSPSSRPGQAFAREGLALSPPPWGGIPFDYEKVVQPVLDANCVRCHDTRSQSKLDLRGQRDANRIPASYRTLVTGGWVDYFDWIYGARPFMAEPLSFGTSKSRIFTTLADKQHESVVLKPDEMRALKAWIDLNCPLWPDYRYRLDRPK